MGSTFRLSRSKKFCVRHCFGFGCSLNRRVSTRVFDVDVQLPCYSFPIGEGFATQGSYKTEKYNLISEGRRRSYGKRTSHRRR